jgi:N-carbamoyl-L-amino-acid hydrolase
VAQPPDSFDRMWDELVPVGRSPESGGYRRFAWTATDHQLREWFADQAQRRGLDLTLDRAGNQWAWWGDPDGAARAGRPGLVIGSHLDSVPDGGAYDGPLGVLSAFAAVDALRAAGFSPSRPIGVVNFGDEEGARFGIACAGSRLITGALEADRALALTDADGLSLAEALTAAGRQPEQLAADRETLDRIGMFVELHVEQGRGLIEEDQPVAIGSAIWPHGRWRIDLPGMANHAGTTRLVDRDDPMLGYARLVLAAREAAERHQSLATVGKIFAVPNGVNAIASQVTAWLDARGADPDRLRLLVADLAELAGAEGGRLVPESWTELTAFEPELIQRIGRVLPQAPVLATGAGHDAGILANAGVPTAMLFVRNPTGISHSPAEHAEVADCHQGVRALTEVVAELAGEND